MDLNTLLTAGTYECASTDDNIPDVYAGTCVVQQLQSYLVLQTYTETSTSAVFTRKILSNAGLVQIGTWISTDPGTRSTWSTINETPTDYVSRWPTFAEVQQKPTTLAGFGITDGVSLSGAAFVGNVSVQNGRDFELKQSVAGTYNSIKFSDSSGALKAKIQYSDSDGLVIGSNLNVQGSVLTSGDQSSAVNSFTRKDYVDSGLNTKLNLSGGTLTGELKTSVAQSTAVNAFTRKDYVDSGLNTKLNLSGGTLTGVVTSTVSGTPYVFAGGSIAARADVMSFDATKYSLVTGSVSSYLCGNVQYTSSGWKKHDDSQPSGLIAVSKSLNPLFYYSNSGDTNPVATSYVMWHSGNFDPSTKLNLTGGTLTGTLTGTTFVGALSGTASNASTLDNIDSTGFGRAYSSSYSFGGSATACTTAEFITLLINLGAFNTPYWFAKGSWSYATNYYITDTGYGIIQLAGATVEVMGNSDAYTIRIHTAPTTSVGGAINADFVYVNHGSGYSPKWHRIYSTDYKPTPADIGAAAAGHTHSYLSNGDHLMGNGTGNDYNTGGIETRGNGSANTVYPTVGFHQPGLYAGSIQQRSGTDFAFFRQGGSAYANVYASTFVGALSGNATSATSASYLANARTLTIGGTGKPFDGSASQSWTLAEIGAVASADVDTVLAAAYTTSSTNVPAVGSLALVARTSSYATASALNYATSIAGSALKLGVYGGGVSSVVLTGTWKMLSYMEPVTTANTIVVQYGLAVRIA